MKQLNLTADTPELQRIKDYLQENVSDTLAYKINNGTPFEKDGKPLTNKKNLAGFMQYAVDEARKLAEKNARYACVEDKTVFGWAIHYFEEDSIEGTLFYMDGEEYKPAPKPKTATKTNNAPVTQKKPEPKAQFSLFDMMEEKADEHKTTETNDTEADDEDDTISEEEQREIMRELAEEEAETQDRTLQPEKPKGSPLYLRYMDIQSKYPNSIVAIRLGDFYEVFGDNATILANELNLTLTGRDCGLLSRVPMIGFPYHAAEVYFKKISINHSIVVAETETELQQIPKQVNETENAIDPETGEILTEEDMRKFDGNIFDEEPDNAIEEHNLSKSFNASALCILADIFDKDLEVK